MTLYICITAWLFVLLLLGLRNDSVYLAEIWPDRPEDKKIRREQTIVSILAFATFMLLWFLTAFRSSEIGNDTENYLNMFDLFSQGLNREYSIEVGYQFLNVLIGKFTHDWHCFLIIIATIMYGGVGLYIYKFSRNPVVSLCLFFSCFFPAFASMFRQGIAMVIALYGYQLLKNGKKIPAAIIFLLAASFHLSAIVCFLLFFDFKIWGKRWIVLGAVAVCAVVSRFGVVKAVVDLVVPKYSHYFESQYASSGWLAISYYLLSYIVLYYLVSKSLIEDHRPDQTVAANFGLLMIFTAFGYAVNIFDRVGEYFLLIAITEFPNVLYRGKVKHFRLWLLGICSVMLVMFLLILIYRPGWNHLYPYEFWPSSIFAGNR